MNDVLSHIRVESACLNLQVYHKVTQKGKMVNGYIHELGYLNPSYPVPCKEILPVGVVAEFIEWMVIFMTVYPMALPCGRSVCQITFFRNLQSTGSFSSASPVKASYNHEN